MILVNLPPLDLKPHDAFSTESSEVLHKLLTDFNVGISSMRLNLGRSLNTGTKAKVKMFDLDTFLRSITHDPSFTTQTKKLVDTKGFCEMYNP